MISCFSCENEAHFLEKGTNRSFCNESCQDLYYYPLNGKEGRKRNFLEKEEENIPDIVSESLKIRIRNLNREFSKLSHKKGRHVERNRLSRIKDEIIQKLELLYNNSMDKFSYYSTQLEMRDNEREMEKLNTRIVAEREKEHTFRENVALYYGATLNDVVSSYDNLIDYYKQAKKRMMSITEEKTQLSSQHEILLTEVIQMAISLDMKIDLSLNEQDELLQSQELFFREEALSIKKFLKKFEKYFKSLVYTPIEVIEIGDTDSEEGVFEIQESGEPEVSPGLTFPQKSVLDECKSRAKVLSDRAPNPRGMNFNNIIQFLQNCDVIIHLPLFTIIDDLIQKKDKYLRNLFEVNTSCGNNNKQLRTDWENKIFVNDLYKKFKAHDRVKYATLNTAMTSYGIRRLASQYGTVYLIMKSSIKERCTLTPSDSSYDSITEKDLATFDHMSHILDKFRNIPTVENIIKMSDTKDFRYLEVQIHGELRFDRDVETIMINSKYKNEFAVKLKKFFNSIGVKEIPFKYFDDPLNPV